MKNFFSSVLALIAIVPQAVVNVAINGATIVNPWLTGRKLTFLANVGVLAPTDSLTFTVQARRIGTSTWDNVKKDGGSTDLTFVVADGGTGESNVTLGGLDLVRLKSGATGNLPPVSGTQYTYDAIRLSVVNAVNQSTLVGVTAVISDLFTEPSAQTDVLFAEQLPQ